jgi:putative Mn2+ efflux pump MntP
MTILEIILIAISLSMDAFAVSVTMGITTASPAEKGPVVKKPGLIEMLIPGIYFGFFQALMPFLGYFGGTLFASRIQQIDYWVVFALLSFIGGKMIKDSFSKDNDETVNGNSFGFIKMLLLAIATSIDALAIGITFSFYQINILSAITIIGLTTFCISTAGVKTGRLFGTKFKSKAEFIGGAVLVTLGFKVLIENLFLGKA